MVAVAGDSQRARSDGIMREVDGRNRDHGAVRNLQRSVTHLTHCHFVGTPVREVSHRDGAGAEEVLAHAGGTAGHNSAVVDLKQAEIVLGLADREGPAGRVQLSTVYAQGTGTGVGSHED